jgi:hypothetical protein
VASTYPNLRPTMPRSANLLDKDHSKDCVLRSIDDVELHIVSRIRSPSNLIPIIVLHTLTLTLTLTLALSIDGSLMLQPKMQGEEMSAKVGVESGIVKQQSR